MKSAEIIAVGTELLIGDTLNTNSNYIAKELVSLGIAVYHHTIVGDNPNRLEDAIKTALSRCDIVITTGGLGPTEDDITVQTSAKVLGKEVEIHPPSLEQTTAFFKKQAIERGLSDDLDAEKIKSATTQSQVIGDAKVLLNKNGLAPGSIAIKDNKTLIILPGPPEEMKNMWKDASEYLQSISDSYLVSKTIHMSGIGESSAESILQDIIHSQTNPTIAPYAKSGGGVSFRITASGDSTQQAAELIEPMRKLVYDRLGEHIFGEDNDTLEKSVIDMLKNKNKTLAVAESITGGMIVSRLISIPGTSQVLKEGLVCYSEDSKVNRGLVTRSELDKYTAVSEFTAEQMAKNIAISTGADIGISTTGLAQMTSQDKKANQGMAYVAIYYSGNTHVFNYNGLGDRDRIRNSCSTFLIEKLRRFLVEIA